MTFGKLKNLSVVGLSLCVLSILAGAVVRATGSGNGCGTSWPTCNGNILPSSSDISAVIEYTHRALSGALLIITFLLFVYCRQHQSKDLLRKFSGALLFFVVLEALIGMTIVLLEWVAYNTSLARLIAVPIHLVNTFSLLALYVIVYSILKYNIEKLNFFYSKRFVFSCFLFFLVAGFGSITALADLLYPSKSFLQGLEMDFNSASQILTRLRVFHPLAATVLLFWMFSESNRLSNKEGIGFATNLKRLSLIAAFIGLLNVLININILVSIFHLLFADALWGVYIYSNMDKSYNFKKNFK